MLKKSKIEAENLAKVEICTGQKLQTLCIADAAVRGGFRGNNEDPHIAVHETHHGWSMQQLFCSFDGTTFLIRAVGSPVQVYYRAGIVYF
jgi:hypothetical protein